MCIYCGTAKYRKIYENHFGKIPRDETGRSYEIHHVDGNRKNNDPMNLKAVTIKEHYDIHYSQGDWAACLRIAAKMKLSHEELSRIASIVQTTLVNNGEHHWLTIEHSDNSRKRELEKIRNGTHNFADGDLCRQRVVDGTHNFLGGELSGIVSRARVAAGTHNFLGENNPSYARVANGTHNFLGDNNPSHNRMLNGTHNFLSQFDNGIHPTQIKKTCIHCGKTMGSGQYGRWHGDKCKNKIECN